MRAAFGLVLGIATAFHLANASALAQQNTIPRSGNDFIDGCRASTLNNNERLALQGQCLGMIGAVLDFNSLYDMKLYCMPLSVTVGQAGRVLVRYMDTHPARLNEPALVLAISAFQEAWPCKT